MINTLTYIQHAAAATIDDHARVYVVTRIVYMEMCERIIK